MTGSIDFQELRDSARELLAAQCASDTVLRVIAGERALADTLWRTMAGLGWQGLAIAEPYGGLGLGRGDLMAIYYELGRYCAPLPFLGTMLAAEALALCGSAAQRERYLPAIADGSLRAAVMAPELAFAPQQLALTVSGGDELSLSGWVEHLADARDADLLVLFARHVDGELTALLVEPVADALPRETIATVDQTRHFCALRCDGLRLPRARVLATGPEASRLAGALLDHAALALACDSSGGAEHVFEKTIAYLQTRRQFNRLIGSFQALKHRCADMKVQLEASGSAVEKAVQTACAGGALALPAGLAKAYAGDVYARVAGEAMQLHGGIGFTWEHDCHLFLKRAKLNQMLFGAGHWHRDRCAALLLTGNDGVAT